MSNLANKNKEYEFKAEKAWVSEGRLCVLLSDGRELRIPLEHYPVLKNASEKELAKVEIFGEGTAIRFPTIDEDLTVEGLVLGTQTK